MLKGKTGIVCLSLIVGIAIIFAFTACDDSSTDTPVSVQTALSDSRFNGVFKNTLANGMYSIWEFDGTNKAVYSFTLLGLTTMEMEIKLENGHLWSRKWNADVSWDDEGAYSFVSGNLILNELTFYKQDNGGTHTHSFGNWQTNATQHWKVCTSSGCTTPPAESERGNHTGTPNCTVCNYPTGGGEFPPDTYVIIGSGTDFTVIKNGATIGTANQGFFDAIDTIQTNAEGNDCTIQFGDGENALDIGNGYASFNNFDNTWGIITLTGKITSSNGLTATSSTITISTNANVISTAYIANTSTSAGNGSAVYVNTGTITVNGGTVSGTGAYAIVNNAGTLTINDGMIINSSISTGIAVGNMGGVITINGGTVSSTDRAVVNITGTGTITIHDPPTVIVGNTSGTITWVPPKS